MKYLHVFVTEKGIKKAIRFNTDTPSVTEVKTSIKIANGMKDVEFKFVSLPLYLAVEMHRFT